MSGTESKGDLFAAAKQLADSEIQLLKTIESSRKHPNTSKMSVTNNAKRTSARVMNAKASQVILAAKQKAMQRKKEEQKFHEIIITDIYQKSVTALQSMHRKDTGLVFDQSMAAEHKCLWDENYPESPARFTQVLQRCEDLGLVKRCTLIPARSATKEELLLKHDPKLIEQLQITEDCNDLEKLEQLASKYDAVYFHPSTYKLSLLATGSTISLVESVCRGQVQNGMAIVRPPGHHAMKSEYCGYCYFNNVAIAVEKVLQDNLAKRVLIVDWDVHHGQATQQMFYDDPRVVYFSIHRYEYGEFWPNLRESDFDYVGKDRGEGYNFNIPLNKTGMTNADYIAIFQQVLLPMAYEFQPDLIVISAGYDAAVGCPEGEMEITPACYAHLVSQLMSLASGKVAVVLEGGYCLKSLAESAALTLRTLLGDPCPMLQNLQTPSDSIRDTILNVIYAHKPYWMCYQYQDQYSINSIPSNDVEKLSRHKPVVIYRGTVDEPKVYETRNCYPVVSPELQAEIDKKINTLIQITSLNKAPHRLGIVYDTIMTKHNDFSDESHPEKPERLTGIWAKCHEYGVLKRSFLIQSREATDEELLLVHTKEYLDTIRDTAHLKQSELGKRASKYNSIYLNNKTDICARISAGSLLQVVDSVLNGEVQCGVAIVRPPGHHAEQDAACGFCIFNNVAMAAKYAVQFHHLKRVLIVDWDIHHGNGIQAMVEDDPSILYISVHRYDRGSFFPNSKEANYDRVGTGKGEGYIVNVPWNKKGMGDPEYIAAFQQVVLPIAYQFNPELVLVSAGFDACIGDPLGGCKVSPEMYGHLTHWLSSLANGRIVLSLEGGYNVNSISYAMTICAKTLLGDPLPMLDPTPTPNLSAIFSINNTLKTHRQYWPNLKFQLLLPKEQDVLLRNDLSEIIEADYKADFNLLIDKVNDRQAMSKLQNEIENLKIKNSENGEFLKHSKTGIKDCGNTDGDSSKSGQGPSKDDVPSCSSSSASGTNAQSGTLAGYLSENLNALLNEDMFAVIPLRDCPHVETVKNVPESGIDVNAPCHECASTVENWICLDCYTVHCARSVNQHGLTHNQETEHPMTLSLSDLSVWCYGCEAYIDHPRLYNARNAAHLKKFGQELPWTYQEPLLEVSKPQ